MKTKNHILTLLENGVSFNTISNLNDTQIKVLAEKFETKEAVTVSKKANQPSTDIIATGSGTVGMKTPGGQPINVEINGQAKFDKVPQGTEVKSLSETGSGETTESEELEERFKSKAQQGLFWAKCRNEKGSAKEKWCKMAREFSKSTSKKQYKNMPNKKHPEKTVKRTKKITNEELENFLENRIVNMLDEYINPTMSKKQIIDTILEKSEKSNSMILRKPKKVTMFSNESGNEMKRMKKPIGNLYSLGEDTKEKERTKEREKTKTPKRRNPFKDPNPGVEEKPKARREFKENTKEKERTKEREKTKTPKRRNPFKDPNPGVKEKPKADIEKQKSDFMMAIKKAVSL